MQFRIPAFRRPTRRLRFFGAALLFGAAFAALQLASPDALHAEYGFINTRGEYVIPPQFRRVDEFHEGFAVVTNERRIKGYVNRSGEMAVPFRFSRAYRFYDPGVAFVKIGGVDGYRLIDASGAFASERIFEDNAYFFEGLAKIEVGDKCGYVDARGATVAEPVYFDCGAFQHGRAKVGKGEAYGYLGTDGKFAIPPRLGQAGSFEEMQGQILARVKIGGRTGLIDREGKIVMQPKYGTVGGYGEGLFPVRLAAGKWGYINMQNQIVIPAKYEWASTCHGGLCNITLGGKEGFIDLQGDVKIPPRYSDAGKFDDGGPYVRATLNGTELFIGKDGERFGPEGVDWMGIAADNRVPFRTAAAKRYGYLDFEGNVAVEAKFCGASEFSEGLAGVEACD